MKQQLVVLIGFLLMLFMMFPLISIFNQHQVLYGLPVQTLYIFGVWILAVFASAIIIVRKKAKR